jgi:hypothetical protein
MIEACDQRKPCRRGRGHQTATMRLPGTRLRPRGATATIAGSKRKVA